MSLKAFHLCFMVCAMLFTGGLGLWGIRDYFHGSGEELSLGFALIAVVALPIMVWYTFWFLRKMKKVGWL
jgi:hypothetical protein